MAEKLDGFDYIKFFIQHLKKEKLKTKNYLKKHSQQIVSTYNGENDTLPQKMNKEPELGS